jgi:hypothetical protein
LLAKVRTKLARRDAERPAIHRAHRADLIGHDRGRKEARRFPRNRPDSSSWKAVSSSAATPGASFCNLFIEICGPAIIAMGEDEVAFAGSGSLLGPTAALRAGSAILRDGAAERMLSSISQEGKTAGVLDIDGELIPLVSKKEP